MKTTNWRSRAVPKSSKIEVFNQYLNAVQGIAVIIGVVTAIVGAWLAYGQLQEISAQTGLQARTLADTRRIASANLFLEFRKKFDDPKYADLVESIKSNKTDYHIVEKGNIVVKEKNNTQKATKFPDVLVEEYMDNFEDLAYLVQDKLIESDMAYRHFSYDVEKAWCNVDVKQIIKGAHDNDKSITATTDPIYGHFEDLAKTFLAREGQDCKDLAEQ